MNILDVQDKLKNLSEQQLVQEMQMPSGSAPQFLILSEITRRKRMRDSLQTQQSNGATVAEEVVAAAGVPSGGIASMAQSMAPNSSIAQNAGFNPAQSMPMESEQQDPVMRMYGGGYVQRMQEGGIVVRNGRRYIQMEDGSLVDAMTGARVPVPGAETFMEDWMQPEVMTPPNIGSYAPPSLAPSTTAFGTVPTLLGDSMMSRAQTSGGAPQVDLDLVGDAAPSMGMPSPMSSFTSRMMGFEPNDEDSLFRSVNPSYSEGRADAFPSYLDPPTPLPDTRGTPIYENMADMVSMGGRPAFMPPIERARPDMVPQSEFIDPYAAMLGDLAPQVSQPAPAAPVSRNPIAEFQENFDLGFTDEPVPGIMERIFGADALERAGIGTSRDAPVPQPPAQTPDQTTEEEASASDAELAAILSGGGDDTAPLARPDVGGAGVVGGAVRPAGMSSYEQELVDAMARAERRAEQDKWLSLAQVGLNLMSSTQPTLGGALGEAGLAGLESYRGARNTAEEERLGLSKALFDIQQQREAAVAAQRAAGARASTSGIPSWSEYESMYNLLTVPQEDPITGEKTRVPRNEQAAATLRQLEDEINRSVGARIAPAI